MEPFFYLIVFVFGLIVGSFLNCVIYRLEKGGSFLRGRSFCPHCKRTLSWQELIPVFSFLWLRGRCKRCRQKISLQYPLVELATALLFLLAFWRLGFSFDLAFGFLILSFLMVIFVYDLKHYLIPDSVIYPAIALALIFNFQFLISNQFSIFQFSILSAFGAAGFFAAIVLVSRGKWMGVGDIKLAFLMGLILGYPNILVALFLAFSLGAIMGIGLIMAGKKTMKSEVPFGPFLVTGTFAAMFCGQKLINWYVQSFYFN